MAAILKAVGFVAMGVFLAVGVLDNIKGPIDSSVIRDNTLSKAYMDKNKEQYAKCYRSVHSISVGSVAFSYNTYNMAASQSDRIKNVEAKYMQIVKDRCDKPISDYEAYFATYKQTNAKLADASVSTLDRILAKAKAPDNSWQYEPSSARLAAPLDGDRAEVEQFFKAELGY